MRAAFALVLPFLVSCAPPIDPVMRATIDREVAASPHDATYPPPAPTMNAPMPLATGQWTRFKVVRSDGRPSVVTYKVVGQEGDAFWIETVSERYTGRSAIKMLVAFGNRSDPAQTDIRRLIVRQGTHAPQDFPPSMIGIVRGTYASVVRGLVLRWDGLPRETKGSTAGTFTDAFKAKTEVNLYGYSSRATTWSHPAVPVQGLVHSDSEDGTKVDLLDFGLTGATSEL